ncbi:C4-dicarboxylate transport protein 1 [Durusdinium trenchii]|uniref:Amino acid transporter n=1 Tax=Durusdinium trenchii TaxID=1381693 RepID=A0ABP0I2S8_9DINO
MEQRARHDVLPSKTGRWIAVGLLLGVICGIVFGEYCGWLKPFGQAYVGLLQMTVLPYLVISLVAKMARLDLQSARKMGLVALVILAVFWLSGIALITAVSAVLPPVPGASFFSPPSSLEGIGESDLLLQFIPTNIFRSLADEYVPAVVIFFLFFGTALIVVPGKEPLLDSLDLCAEGIGRINTFLIRLAPLGLFMLTADAAGTLRVDELSRLQAYLIIFGLACAITTFLILPLLVSSVTNIGYRELLRAAQEPLLTAIATGKLFVVLPQIVDKCEQLLADEQDTIEGDQESTARVIVPLAYPFPHLGKMFSLLFLAFAAWYVGDPLSPVQSMTMASVGTVSSFASPLVTIPYLLDAYQLPQDLMPLFLRPGFVTTRLADVVGVMHLMALTLITTQVLSQKWRVRWRRLLWAAALVLLVLVVGGSVSRSYLAATTVKDDLDQRFLALSIPSPHGDVHVYRSRADVPERPPRSGSTLDQVRSENVLRVGYHADHLPYSFFNHHGELVGLDVELMHRLATRLDVRLEFVPYEYENCVDQLESGEVDLLVGGLMITPERLLHVGFTNPYQSATLSVVLPDHRRREFDTWDDPDRVEDVRLAVGYADLVSPARRRLPDAKVVEISEIRSYFEDRDQQIDGLIMQAEEASAWNVLHPEFAVVVPRPVVRRPVAMAVRPQDLEWIVMLNGWIEFERFAGSLERLRGFWIEGGGTKKRRPRWSVIRDVLHWVP